MKSLIKELIENLLNPKSAEEKKFNLRQDLLIKADRGIYLREYLKTRAWQDYNRKVIYNSLESGMGRLLRDGPLMNEVDIKATIASMRANLNQIEDMRLAIKIGEEAQMKLERMKT